MVSKIWEVKIINKTSFEINNFSQDDIIFNNGTAVLFKEERVFNFDSLNEQIEKKKILGFDPDRSEKIIEMYKYFDNNEKNIWSDEIINDNESVRKLYQSYGVEIHPVTTFIGSVASSEIIKLVSNKYLDKSVVDLGR